jgi:hypothetical protein
LVSLLPHAIFLNQKVNIKEENYDLLQIFDLILMLLLTFSVFLLGLVSQGGLYALLYCLILLMNMLYLSADVILVELPRLLHLIKVLLELAIKLMIARPINNLFRIPLVHT